MAIALNSRALFTAQELEDSFLGSIEDDVSTDAAANTEVLAVINAASDMVREHLDRPILVQSRTLILNGMWFKVGRTSYSHRARLVEWPLVEVTSSTTVSIGDANPGGQEIYSNVKHDEITGFVGYRRHDWANVAAVISALGDVAALTVLPPVLPYQIRDVALDLARFLYQNRKTGRHTGSRKVTRLPSGDVQIDAADRAYIERALSRIDRYRHVAI